MIEFRWVVILTLWTLLIGPVVDFSRYTPVAQATRGKTPATVTNGKNAR